jgi:hypothetical protein
MRSKSLRDAAVAFVVIGCMMEIVGIALVATPNINTVATGTGASSACREPLSTDAVRRTRASNAVRRARRGISPRPVIERR